MIWSKFFAAGYDYGMHFLEKKYLNARRAKLISGLSGKILEVGVGTGVNFEHYKGDIVLIGIDPSPYMLSRAEKRKDISIKSDFITLHNIGCGDPELDQLISPNSLDKIVCTLVLCTIPDPVKAISNFMKWLKPGGHLIILEHIRSHNHLTARLQDMINPVWKIIGDGCNVNRSTDEIISQSGFRMLREERFKIGLPFFEAEYEKPDYQNI
jgi:ubiquinone/menaquinone biosynthesis C-methylase UbiE